MLLTEKSAKRVQIRSGSIVGTVAKQPSGAPMVLLTPQAEATVLGTHFLFETGKDNSRLTVYEGRVALKRMSEIGRASCRERVCQYV